MGLKNLMISKNDISESPLRTHLKIKLGNKKNLNREKEGVLKTKYKNLHQLRAYTERIGSTYINRVQNLDNKWTKIDHLLQYFLFVEDSSKDILTKKIIEVTNYSLTISYVNYELMLIGCTHIRT